RRPDGPFAPDGTRTLCGVDLVAAGRFKHYGRAGHLSLDKCRLRAAADRAVHGGFAGPDFFSRPADVPKPARPYGFVGATGGRPRQGMIGLSGRSEAWYRVRFGS